MEQEGLNWGGGVEGEVVEEEWGETNNILKTFGKDGRKPITIDCAS